MPEEKTSVEGEGEKENSQKNQTTPESQKQGGGEGAAPEITVPRRNAEYWERQNAKQSRAEFFKSKTSKSEDEDEAGDDEDAPLTRREYRTLQERERKDWEKEQSARLMETNDSISIANFLSYSNPLISLL